MQARLVVRLRELEASLRDCVPRLAFAAAVNQEAACDLDASGCPAAAASRRAVAAVASLLAQRLKALADEGADTAEMPSLAAHAARVLQAHLAASGAAPGSPWPSALPSAPSEAAPSTALTSSAARHEAAALCGSPGGQEEEDARGGKRPRKDSPGGGAKRLREASPAPDSDATAEEPQQPAAPLAALDVAPPAFQPAGGAAVQESQRSMLGSISPGRGAGAALQQGLVTPAPPAAGGAVGGGGSGSGSGRGSGAAAEAGPPAGGAGVTPWLFSLVPPSVPPSHPNTSPEALQLNQLGQRLFFRSQGEPQREGCLPDCPDSDGVMDQALRMALGLQAAQAAAQGLGGSAGATPADGAAAGEAEEEQLFGGADWATPAARSDGLASPAPQPRELDAEQERGPSPPGSQPPAPDAAATPPSPVADAHMDEGEPGGAMEEEAAEEATARGGTQPMSTQPLGALSNDSWRASQEVLV